MYNEREAQAMHENELALGSKLPYESHELIPPQREKLNLYFAGLYVPT